MIFDSTIISYILLQNSTLLKTEGNLEEQYIFLYKAFKRTIVVLYKALRKQPNFTPPAQWLSADSCHGS